MVIPRPDPPHRIHARMRIIALFAILGIGHSWKYTHTRIQISSMKMSTTSSPTELLIEIPDVNITPPLTTSPSTENLTLEKVKKSPIGSKPVISIPGDSTETTPYQQAVVAVHFFITSLNLANAMGLFDTSSSADVLNPITALVIGAFSVVLGDLGTGIFHWSVDNYGSLETPLFGSVCAAFQGHHETPWTITFRGFANNVYKICYGTIPALSAVLAVHPAAGTQLFFTLFINWWMLSQEFHKYSHMKTPPKFVKFLQNRGIILSRKEHGLHHTAPFEGHYCILTGICNPALDGTNFFRHLERLVFNLTGNEPNTWKIEPSLRNRT